PPPSAAHSGQAHGEPSPHPSLAETCFASSLTFPTTSPSIRDERSTPQFICRDHKYTIRLRIWNIDHAEVTTGAGLADGDPRSFLTRAILSWTLQDVRYLILVDIMAVDVRLACVWITVE